MSKLLCGHFGQIHPDCRRWKLIMYQLIQELQNPIYYDLTDEEASTLISNKTVTIRQPVKTWKLKQIAIEGGYYPKLVIAKDDINLPVEVRGLVISVLAWIDDPRIDTCDVDLPSSSFMINSLLRLGFINEAQYNQILELANYTIPWSISVGLSDPVGPGLVSNARDVIRGDSAIID